MLRLSLLLCLIALPVMAAPLSGVKTTALSAQLYAVGLAVWRSDFADCGGTSAQISGVSRQWRGSAGVGGHAGFRRSNGWGDAVLLGLIDDVRVEGSKGVASGPLFCGCRPGSKKNLTLGEIECGLLSGLSVRRC